LLATSPSVTDCIDAIDTSGERNQDGARLKGQTELWRSG
jgi:hypothetical protein